MKFILFVLSFYLSSCHDNLTLNQITFNKEVRYKVTIEGHINKPGIYLISKNEQLSQLIKKAGGYKNNAQKISKKIVFKDNMKIFINSKRISSKLNLNLVSSTELIRIKGIGPKLAGKIISYRQEYHNFRSISELKNIKGIKEKLFNKIYEYFTL